VKRFTDYMLPFLFLSLAPGQRFQFEAALTSDELRTRIQCEDPGNLEASRLVEHVIKAPHKKTALNATPVLLSIDSCRFINSDTPQVRTARTRSIYAGLLLYALPQRAPPACASIV
jgi:hypothetical protein